MQPSDLYQKKTGEVDLEKASELDLRKILYFAPKGGIIQFMGHRALIIDALAMGLLRIKLIDNFGMIIARSILTCLGYAHGWATAENLSREYPNLTLNNIARGPALHMAQGFSGVSKCKISYEPFLRSFNTWQDSYEAEQHMLHMGISHEPVCWTLTGYVSGYCSRLEGREVYSIERQCIGKGDAVCLIETRDREDWGDEIEPYLPYFRSSTIDKTLKNVTDKLLQSERKMKAYIQLGNGNDSAEWENCRSVSMRKTITLARRVAKMDSSVAVTGESGVGKEVIARIIHSESPRAIAPFVAINCSAVAESLLESEFFGHVKGAFTGANKDRMGLIEAAKDGTLFLDEVAELSPGMQAKLLRVLQEKEIRRVGENISRPLNVRFISATNRDLRKEVEEGRFRKDLFYRLCVFEIHVPPLRKRTSDIPPLACSFLESISSSMGKKVIGFSPEVIDVMMRYDWPGNVRELRNIIEHAVAFCGGKRVELADLPLAIRSVGFDKAPGGIIRTIEEVEREQILSAIRQLNGNKAEAAKRLGIGLTSLYRKLKKYGVRETLRMQPA